MPVLAVKIRCRSRRTSRSATSRCCGTSRACSGRWPRPRRRGGSWTGSTRPSLDAVESGPGAGAGTGLAAARRGGPAGADGALRAGSRWPGSGDRLRRQPGHLPLGEGAAAATFKKGFGYHPLTGVAGQHRRSPGRDAAARERRLATPPPITSRSPTRRSPDPRRPRHGAPILVRCDGAGATTAWLDHLRAQRDQQGLDLSFSVGFTVTDQVKDAIAVLPESVWTAAVDADGSPRDGAGAQVAELTGLLPGLTAAGLAGRDAGPGPPGTTRIPAPSSACSKPTTGGATSAWPPTPPADSWPFLEARHRAHARVEDRISATSTPGWAGSRPGSSRSTRSGSSSR